jgi:TonB-dependent starch-binding outer membrane protein SusC
MIDNSYSVGRAATNWRVKSAQISLKAGLLAVIMLFLTVSAQVALAQDNSVTGKVSDGKGSPLPGVSIAVKGTTRGTNSDAEGNYKVQAPASAVLVYSYVGFEVQEIAVGNKTTINVTLVEDNKSLNEVVVIGYGTVKKKDLTGAVNTIGTKDFNKGIITSPEQLLQGRVPGVAITQNNGEPGGGINVRIRGTSSVRANNNPLFVVDGVPLSGNDTAGDGQNSGIGSSAAKNPLNFFNPEDIASVDILKDASATAIYGSRGANGVVLITTKKGKTGRGSLEYSPSVGFSTITKRYDLLSADEFARLQPAQDQKARIDYQDELFRTGITNQHNLAYGGGDGNGGNYRFSLGYLDQEGILARNAMNRVAASFNGNKKFINNRLVLGVQLTVSQTKDNNIPVTDNSGYQGDLLGNILKANPTMAIYKADGTFNQSTNVAEPNPIALLSLSKDNTSTLRTLGNINAEYEILKGLRFKAVYGFDKSMSSRKAAFSRDLIYQDIQNVGRLFLTDIQIENSLFDGYFTYDKEFGKVTVNALLGYEYQRFDYYFQRATGTNFSTNKLDLMINNAASANNQNGFGSLIQNTDANTNELRSYFGRVNVGFGKFLATATLRADGSTRFGPNFQVGYFPSAALAYKLSDEAFIPKDVFSDLKLRVGYGITGNQELPHNLHQQRQRYGSWNFNSNADNREGGALTDRSFTNFDLKWEQTTQTNVGLDFALAGNRLSGNLEYYHKNTTDLLIQVTSAQPALTPFTWSNLDADVINQGFELGLNYVAIDKPDFGWDVQFNAAYNSNVVRNFNGLIDTGQINGQGLSGAFVQRIAEGQPLFSFFLREFGGFDDQGNSIYPSGDFQKFIGKSPLPTVTSGLTNNIRWKNFNLSLFFNGVFGNYIYSNTANAFFTKGAFNNGRNVTRNVPSLTEGAFNAPEVSTRFLEAGDFVRLQNATLGYRFNTGSNSPFSNLRVFVTGQNLLLFTGYSGQDPEVSTNKAINDVPSLGIDYTAYPRARTITVGANFAF